MLKTVDPDADEGKKPGPSQDVDKNHEGEQKGTRVTEGDKNRKVSYIFSTLSLALQSLGPLTTGFFLLKLVHHSAQQLSLAPSRDPCQAEPCHLNLSSPHALTNIYAG